MNCKTQYGQCDESMQQELTKYLNKSYSEVKKNTNLYLKNNFLINDYFVQYKFPNKLQVDVIIKKAIFCLKSKEYNTFAFVDKNGTVLKLRSSCGLPLVNIKGKAPNVGELVDEKTLVSLRVINETYTSYNIKEGKLINDSLEVRFPRGYKVIFPLDRDVQVLFGSLKLIINRLNSEDSASNIKEGRVRVIDLRFSNPVLR